MSLYVDREVDDVNQFHVQLDLWPDARSAQTTAAALPDEELFRQRFAFIQEEAAELGQAYLDGDLPAFADALVDLVYVIKGLVLMAGLGPTWERHWDEVQRANLAKVPGTTHRGVARDARKPAGWRPPDHAVILRTAGREARRG